MTTRKVKELIRFTELFAKGGLPGTRQFDDRLKSLQSKQLTVLRNELALRDERRAAKTPDALPQSTSRRQRSAPRQALAA